jgi:sulfate adenylyltransferase subunit 2
MKPLSHLDWLEAESIYILRETVAECRSPVLLYSIGKDSSVLLHLAAKAFHPARIPTHCCTSIPPGSFAT